MKTIVTFMAGMVSALALIVLGWYMQESWEEDDEPHGGFHSPPLQVSDEKAAVDAALAWLIESSRRV